MSDKDFLSSQGLVPFRIFLARHRLGYLKHLAKHGLTCHKAFPVAELQTGRGWQTELLQDLKRVSTFKELSCEMLSHRATWIAVWQDLRQCHSWKRTIQRALQHCTATYCLSHSVLPPQHGM